MCGLIAITKPRFPSIFFSSIPNDVEIKTNVTKEAQIVLCFLNLCNKTFLLNFFPYLMIFQSSLYFEKSIYIEKNWGNELWVVDKYLVDTSILLFNDIVKARN